MKPLGLGSYLGNKSAAARTRAIQTGLWAVIAAALLCSLAAFARPAPKAETPPPPPEATVAPEGVAELFTAAWLRAGEGSEDTLVAFYPTLLDLRGMAPRPGLDVATATVAAVEVDDGYWSVTVAASLDGDARYFQVPIYRTAGRYVAASLPAEVAAPTGVGRAPNLATPGLERPALDDPIAAAVDNFARGLLTGGEFARYISPKATIAPVRPAPYVRTELRRLATRPVPGPPKGAEVLAEVVAVNAAGHPSVMHYALTLAVRSGRWEVTALLPAGALGVQPETTTPTTAALLATTSTTVPYSPTTTRASTTSSLPAPTTTTRPPGR